MKLPAIIIILTVALTGCAGVRQGALDLAAEDRMNIETAREVSRQSIETWEFKSGLVRGAFGPRLDQMPALSVKAMDEMDGLVEKHADKEWSDKDLGRALGLQFRMFDPVVQEALRVYAPDLWGAISLTLK